jgi:deoxyribodipyrimidine photo-lyase
VRQQISVVWFRNDLRVQDHPALTSACNSGLPVVAVFSFLQRRSIGGCRANFLGQSLNDLASQLDAIGIPLVFRKQSIESVLEELNSDFDTKAVYFHRLAASEERQDERTLCNWCEKNSVATKSFDDHNLVHPSELPFCECPDLFTTFRKEIEKLLKVQSCLPSPTLIKDRVKLPSHETLSTIKARFNGGETQAWERLQHYIWETDSLRTYKETRNGMLRADDSSKFSPWLAHGCLSARQIYWEVRRYEQERVANESTYWMFFELLWRDFFWLQLGKYGDRFFKASGIQGVNLPWKKNDTLLENWKQGQTGFPLIDASMRELNETGYTSNRARQNVASFFCKNLGLDWRLGAAYYEEQLIDYDVASNWGNWMYQAGVGNDAREFRFFNLAKQADQYDPDGAYRKTYCQELASIPPINLLNLTSSERAKVGYPAEIINFEASARENRKAYERATRS